MNNSVFKIIDGPGTTQTTTGFVATTAGGNVSSITWYIGENIQPTITSIKTPADRNSENAPKDACYIRIASAALSVAKNISPKIGEEYTQGGSKSFTYNLYLGKSSDPKDFSLRRHINYTINTDISGTLVGQEQLAAEDGRVTLTKPESGGLVIGGFGGSTGYTTGAPSEIKGSYNKLLLLQPNTSSSMAADNVRKAWSNNNTTVSQSDIRKYWDPTYTPNLMDQAVVFAYDYCNKLILGGVSEGTWYIPTSAQLQAVYALYGGMKTGGFAGYTMLNPDRYCSCTEHGAPNVWYVMLSADGYTNITGKTIPTNIRCVRDLTEVSSQMVRTDHPSASGYPVIDLSGLAPLNAVLSSTEAAARRDIINAQTPTNDASVHSDASVGGEWNKKMSVQFQVMRTPLSTATWADAYKGCRAYIGKGGFAMVTDFNWTCTESPHVWCVSFGNGNTGSSNKINSHRARCVRDL